MTAGDLLDTDPTNGTINFFPSNKDKFQLIAPDATVNFFLGRLAGEDSTNVRAAATVELRSPLPPSSKVLPFAIPDSCPFGPGMADTKSHGKTPTDTSGSFDPGNTESALAVVGTSPSPIPGGTDSPVTVTVKLTGLKNNKSVSDTQILFQRGGAQFLVQPSAWTPSGDTSSSSDTRTLTVTVPQAVIETPGTWNVWGKIGNKYTSSATMTVGDYEEPSTAVGCDQSASGQFGQMYSPRNNESADQRGLALNIALGLDHQLYPFIDAPSDTDTCGKKNAAPPSGGSQDKPNAVKPNCLLPQTGNDGPWMLKGLITGIEGELGRLDVNRPDGQTKSGCASNVTRESTVINNDRLSCFLKGTHSLNDLAQSSMTEAQAADLLDPEVTKSPRFVWLPVMYAQQRSDIDNNTFMSIKRFVPAFITDETGVATKASSNASAENGVFIGGQLEGLQVFMFNPLTLPVDERAPTTDYDPLLGRTLRLVD